MPRISSTALDFAPVAARLRPPDDLTGEARKLFVQIVLEARPDFFEPTDVHLLARYARALLAEQEADERLRENPIVDLKPSPWLAIWQARDRTVRSLARMLKLNPAGRHAKPVTAERDYIVPNEYDRMALEKRNG
ncbi:phage terminase small subunit [Bradyrhizobium sp. USDA 326]|uniref:P27 family phage terminase small subunit n=1 Tax=unclassified Bradyrhizobium TaxID=2631580 RepID=UPI000F51CC75|nr:P27 family phage terminase small subunit [Bradyrhizobium sp. RP6]RQH09400.1 hypothetical protein EHH60_25045 [Bradyrhizobium sp. RP6]